MDSQINELENNVLTLVSEIENDFSLDRLTKTKKRFDGYLKEIDDYLISVMRCYFFFSKNLIKKSYFLEENKTIKAKHLYLKGKLLDLLPEYSKQAEESLSKSVLNRKKYDFYLKKCYIC